MFFTSYPHQLEGDIFRKLLAPTLNSARSTNSVIRTNATHLFSVISSKLLDPALLASTVNELLSLPKSGKTAGPDHRIALYTMLGHLSSSTSVSPIIIQSASPLLAKETHEATISTLTNALTPHLTLCLQEGVALTPDALTLITKEMGNAKSGIRRAFCSLTGNALWAAVDIRSASSVAFAEAILPSLEASLKVVHTNPLSSPAGPLEGYIAVALLLGPFSRSGKFGEWLLY